MSWVLNLLYVSFLIIASPWLLWRAISSGKNKRGWGQKLLGLIPSRDSTNQLIWIHAVSVGEVNLLAPVIREFKKRNPDLEFAISTTTETGFDLATQKYAEHFVFFCPMDFSWAIKRVIKRLRPTMLILAELELWPNLISTSRLAEVPVAVVNGRLSENSFKGYKRLNRLVRSSFDKLSIVCVQNPTYAERFCELGCDPKNVFVTGNVKFDGVQTDRDDAKVQEFKQLASVKDHEFVMVAGSTQVEEDILAAKVYQRLQAKIPNLRLILVPRHPERCGALIERLDELGFSTIRRSQMSVQSPLSGFDKQSNTGSLESILIVDVIGELGGWWGVANAGYVGGSLGRRGGQNMIEPAAFGIPISFGPNTVNFRQIVDELLAHDAATVIQDQASLFAFVDRAYHDPEWRSAIGSRAKKVVLGHVGASQRTVASLCSSFEVLSKVNSAPGKKQSKVA